MAFPVFKSLLSCCALLAWSGVVLQAAADATKPELPQTEFKTLIDGFNVMEPAGVVNAVPDSEAWEWLRTRVPAFECSDAATQEIYWFRWWALRRQLRRDESSGRWVFTEFITKPRPISSALGHHLMEGRWLRDQQFHDDYVQYWLRGNGGQPQAHLHKYSQWLDDALWQRWLVTQDTAALTGLLDTLVADYRKWETDNGRPDGRFWQYDVRDAMEESISGGRKVKNVRPTINSYMFGNAAALAEIARLAGRPDLAAEFAPKAAALRRLVQETLWDEELEFFGSVTEQGERVKVREEIGFIPWYFNLPERDRGFERAWRQLTDDAGFRAPFGITTAERRHPRFRSHGVGTCEWDGAVWPFATSQTLTALANLLHAGPIPDITAKDYFEAFQTYVRSHRFDGRPYIGEYLDERTGAWLMGANPRSRDYNHSTFADLLITGVIGLRPRADNVVEIAPLLPADAWTWFALDGVRYHCRELTIVWDRDGRRYGRGAGLTVWADGVVIAHSERLERVTGTLR